MARRNSQVSRVVAEPAPVRESPDPTGLAAAGLKVALAFEVLNGIQDWFETDPSLRAVGGLLTLGWLLLVGLAVYGVGQRARWAYWLAGALAVLVLAIQVPLQSQLLYRTLNVGSQSMNASPLSALFTLLKACGYAVFLFALVRGHVRRRAVD
jgi:hypothetical protein